MNSPDVNNDLKRLKNEYADRAKRLSRNNLYALDNVSNMFIHLQRQRDTIRLLSKNDIFPLTGKRIFEIGCGNGGVLREYLYYGASSKNLCGIELIEERAETAIAGLGKGIVLGDAQHLPAGYHSQDLVLQYTVFTSILDENIKKNIAKEMLRILKPNGVIIWYDFWLNPTNPQTKGINKPEIKGLFPDCSFEFRKITLAPPIARRIVPVSWILASILEKINIFNSHYLVLIRPNSK